MEFSSSLMAVVAGVLTPYVDLSWNAGPSKSSPSNVFIHLLLLKEVSEGVCGEAESRRDALLVSRCFCSYRPKCAIAYEG